MPHEAFLKGIPGPRARNRSLNCERLRALCLIVINMKNENAKLVFIYALLGSVESCTDVTHKLPKKVYFNYSPSDFDLTDQKSLLVELKRKKIISNFRLDGDDFVISKPSRSMLNDYYFKLRDKPTPHPEQSTDARIRFDQETGKITIGGKVCPIPINTNQYFLCRSVFAVPFGTPVKEIDILDNMDWAKDYKDSVYDAMREANRKIKHDLGIEKFMAWKARRVIITYKTG